MMRRFQFLKNRFFHIPAAAYLAALLTVAVCAAAGRGDYPIEIRYTLREYADHQAVLAVVVVVTVLPDDLPWEYFSYDEIYESQVTCLALADKKGRIKCIREEQWDEYVDSYEEARRDMPVLVNLMNTISYRIPIIWSWWDDDPWNPLYGDKKHQMTLAAETAEIYDIIMQDDDIPFLDRRIFLNSHFMNRLINETEPTRDLPGISHPLTLEEEEQGELFMIGSVVASWEGKHVPTCHVVGCVETLKYLDSPTVKYAIKKLTELAEIGDAEMRKRLCGQVRPTQE